MKKKGMFSGLLHERWETTPFAREELARYVFENCDFSSLRMMGTPLWPLEKPVSLLETCQVSDGGLRRFWKNVVQEDDPVFLRHIADLMPSRWRAFLTHVSNKSCFSMLDMGHEGYHLCAFTMDCISLNILKHLFEQRWYEDAGLSTTWLLARAVEGNWKEAVVYLLEHGVDPNTTISSANMTPLMLAALGNNFQLFEPLLKAGALPLAKTRDGDTVFSYLTREAKDKRGLLWLEPFHIRLLLQSVDDVQVHVETRTSQSLVQWSASLPQALQDVVLEVQQRQESEAALKRTLELDKNKGERRRRL